MPDRWNTWPVTQEGSMGLNPHRGIATLSKSFTHKCSALSMFCRMATSALLNFFKEGNIQCCMQLYCKRADRIQQMRGANQSAGAPGMLLPTAGTNTALRSSVKQTHWSIRLRSRSTSASVLSEVE